MLDTAGQEEYPAMRSPFLHETFRILRLDRGYQTDKAVLLDRVLDEMRSQLRFQGATGRFGDIPAGFAFAFAFAFALALVLALPPTLALAFLQHFHS